MSEQAPLVLHCGCGETSLPFFMEHCREVRVDIDPNANPDIVANMAELPDGIGPFDSVFSCHSLEHLYPHEVEPCLKGWLKVLKPGGTVVVFVPDLEDVKPDNEILYHAASGPVAGLDMFYGWRKWLKDSPAMAHKTGFISSTLKTTLENSGFTKVTVARLDGPWKYNLYGFGVKEDVI